MEDSTVACYRIQWILNTVHQQSSYDVPHWASTALPCPKDAAPLAHSVPTIVKHFSYMSDINQTCPFQNKIEMTVTVGKPTLHSTFPGKVWWTAYLTLEHSQHWLKKTMWSFSVSFFLRGSIFSEHTMQQPTLSTCKGKRKGKEYRGASFTMAPNTITSLFDVHPKF